MSEPPHELHLGGISDFLVGLGVLARLGERRIQPRKAASGEDVVDALLDRFRAKHDAEIERVLDRHAEL